MLDKIIYIVLQALSSLFKRFFKGPRITVRIIKDEIEKELGGLKFEIENLGQNTTSLDPHIMCKFSYHNRSTGSCHKDTVSYHVRESDRQLEPFKSKILYATHDTKPPYLPFSWYRKYIFSPTKGPKTCVRVRNCHLEPLSWWKFTIESIKYRFGIIKYNPMSIDDYERMKRSQGPH